MYKIYFIDQYNIKISSEQYIEIFEFLNKGVHWIQLIIDEKETLINANNINVIEEIIKQ